MRDMETLIYPYFHKSLSVNKFCSLAKKYQVLMFVGIGLLMKSPPNYYQQSVCRNGEIGRHNRFKPDCRSACGFKSHFRHYRIVEISCEILSILKCVYSSVG